MLTPKKLLAQRIKWTKMSAQSWSARVKDQECLLRINNFPDEPLYTVVVGGESIDLDDPPRRWTIESLGEPETD